MSTLLSPALRRRAWTVGAVAVSVFATLMAGTLESNSGAPGVRIALGVLVNLAAATALVWRHRYPWHVLGLAVVAPIAFGSDATAALIALYTVVAGQRGRQVIGAVAAGLAATGVALMYDAGRARNWSVLTVASDRPEEKGTLVLWPVQPWVPWLVALMLTGAVAGLGYVRRTRGELVVAVRQGSRATDESRRLHEEMLLAEQRTRLAREMHDTLAGSLSQISLLAGGLQVTSTDGPERTANTASQIRNAAHEALVELKKIIGVLRGPGESTAGGAGSVLDGVIGVVSAARSTGLHVTLQADIPPGETGPLANTILTQVVQEGLVNARKHAGGATVHVSVQGSPTEGLRVWVRNGAAAPTAVAGHGSGTGLQGLFERVRSAGGTFEAGPRGAEFVVGAWLPWHS